MGLGKQRLKLLRRTPSLKRLVRLPRPLGVVRLFEPLGVEAELLGHLDQLLRGFRVLDGLRQPSGSVGLVSIVVGLGHGSTFLDMYGSRQKGSKPDCRLAIGRIDRGRKRRGNNILIGRPGAKTCPLFVPGEQKESAFPPAPLLIASRSLHGDPSDRVAPTYEAAIDGCE